MTALLLTFALPASALFGLGEEAETPSVAAFSKNGPVGNAISFSADDFVVQSGGALDAIVISTLPDQAAGVLTLGGQPLNAGDVVTMNAVSGPVLPAPDRLRRHLRRLLLYPPCSPPASPAAGGGELHLLSEANSAPHCGEPGAVHL